MSDLSRPIPRLRGTLGTFVLLVLCAAPLSASGDAGSTSTLVPANPPPDITGAGAYDPNNADNMGIAPTQYTYCQVCSPQAGYSKVASCPAVVGVQNECQSYCHVIDGTPLTFNSNPPHSGNHFPEPERGVGEHTTPVLRGHFVHSMEHGAVVLLYNCSDDCSADLAVFRGVLKANPCLPLIMTPDASLKTRFAMASWTWTLASDTMFSQADANCFAQQHAKHGRECLPRPTDGMLVCPAFSFADATCPSVVTVAP